MPTDPILQRIAAADWTDVPEPTVCSQLIMPILMVLGYGQPTLHKVTEQKTYKLSDPTYMKGSRRVRLDYQPRVYEEGLWVMEAKGTDAEVSPKTLGQVRDYAIHPEVRAALMVTVDRAGFRIFDPWDEHWDTPLLGVAPQEVTERIEELRSVLGVDRVADFVRRRHLDHLRRALGGFNWSSQHLSTEVCDGQAGWVDDRVDGQGADEIAGQAVVAARRRAAVLA